MENLTDKEKQVLIGITKSQYMDWSEPSDLVNQTDWLWSAKECSGLTGKVFSGVCSSLVQKGFVQTDESGKKDEHTICMTEKGVEVIKEFLNK